MNKVCVITGGAYGIGKSMVEAFAQNEYLVIFIDKDEEGVSNTQTQMRDLGLQVEGYQGDIADEAVLSSFVEYVISNYGKIHVLINNACISRGGIASDCSYEDFNYVLQIGVTAPYMLTKLFKDYFVPGGSIINIASTRAFMSQKDTESYTAAKGGIIALTHALAVSFAGKLRVNSISPGWIDTNETYGNDPYPISHSDTSQHLSGRIGKPEDIARTALFLCDENNSFITGENITVDGGMSKLMIYHNENGWTYEGE